jgi:hypothetical protein
MITFKIIWNLLWVIPIVAAKFAYAFCVGMSYGFYAGLQIWMKDENIF